MSQPVRQQYLVLTEILGYQTFTYSTIIDMAAWRFYTLDFIVSCIMINIT